MQFLREKPIDTDFTLTLEGDNPDFDLHVTDILNGEVADTVFANETTVAENTPEQPTTPAPSTDAAVIAFSEL